VHDRAVDPERIEPTSYPDYPDGVAIPKLGLGLCDLDEAELWEVFRDRMESVGGHAVESLVELDALLLESGATLGYCDPALERTLRPTLSPSISLHTDFDRSRYDELQFGITRASAWVAETGTLVLEDRQTSDRLGALSPWIHVAVVDEAARPLATLEAAIASFGDDLNIVWVTGPSKTADVEGILIEGVHGPGRQIALRL
jgi:L-lactate dehydrogenase complex protein LldG